MVLHGQSRRSVVDIMKGSCLHSSRQQMGQSNRIYKGRNIAVLWTAWSRFLRRDLVSSLLILPHPTVSSHQYHSTFHWGVRYYCCKYVYKKRASAHLWFPGAGFPFSLEQWVGMKETGQAQNLLTLISNCLGRGCLSGCFTIGHLEPG